MTAIILLLCILVGLLYAKWIVIMIVFPFQVLYCQVRRRWQKDNMPLHCKLLAAPYYLWEKLFRNGWRRYMLFQVSLLPSCHLRRFVYKCLGAEVGRHAVFHFRTEIRAPYNLKVGAGTIIGDNAILDARNGLTLGQNINLSSNVSIYTEQHEYRDPYFRCTAGAGNAVTIGDRAWIGSNVVILPGVTIGEGAVCCAGCVVTKDVAPFTVVAGVPAKKINDRPHNLEYVFDGSACRLY